MMTKPGMMHLLKRLFGALVLMATTVVPATAEPDAVVSGVRIGDHPQATRFVMDLDKRVDFHLFSLADPYRIVVDLPTLAWNISKPTAPRPVV